MTREEIARTYVDSLSNEQCRELLTVTLLGILPDVFLAVEKATTPGWENLQRLNNCVELTDWRFVEYRKREIIKNLSETLIKENQQ